MRRIFTSSIAALGLVSAVTAFSGAADAAPVANVFQTAASGPALIEKTQYFYGGQNYCWYPDGWRGPGWYWCGYAWRTGYGWGGGYGWRGWRGGGPGWHGGGPGWHGGGPGGPGGHGGGGWHGGGGGGHGGGGHH